MRKPAVEDVLKEGIYGPKETKPEERRQFLGTLRERIIVALRKSQVKEIGLYPEVEEQMKKNPKAHLLLNGNIDYRQLSKYIKLAKKYRINHTIVTNKEYDSDIGLILAMDFAIDKETIFVVKKESFPENGKEGKKKKPSFFKKWFKW